MKKKGEMDIFPLEDCSQWLVLSGIKAEIIEEKKFKKSPPPINS